MTARDSTQPVDHRPESANSPHTGRKMREHTRVPRFTPPRIGEPARFRLLHHAHVIVTKGDSHRLADALAGKGVHPLH
jgi:hypothetical protein